MSDTIIYTNAAHFDRDVLSRERVAVDFYSTECAPCDALAAKFEPLSGIYGRDITFVKIFRQENRPLAASLGVTASPTLLFYQNGNRVGDILTGAIKRAEVVRNLDALLPPDRVRELHAAVKPSLTGCDLLILGGGPSGLTAAIYAAQAHLRTILVDIAMPGGQVTATHQVSNYPGFSDPMAGFMLMHHMSEQARKAGTVYKVSVDVTSINLAKKEVVIDGLETIRAKKIIVATGSSPVPLGIPGEKEFKGNGISYCATCDAKYFEGKSVLVIGGGNTAVEETLFIAKFASNLTLIHRGPALRAHKEAQAKLFAEPKVRVLFEHSPREFKKNPDGTMTVTVESNPGAVRQDFRVDGVFVFIGMRPNLKGFEAQLALDEAGYIKVDALTHASLPDVYAVGDVVYRPYRQITIATADGTVAAMTAAKELG